MYATIEKVNSSQNITNVPLEISTTTESNEANKENENTMVDQTQKGMVVLTCTKCSSKCVGYRKAALHAKYRHSSIRIICCKLCRKIFYTSRAYQVHNTVHGFKMHDIRSKPPKRTYNRPKPSKRTFSTRTELKDQEYVIFIIIF